MKYEELIQDHVVSTKPIHNRLHRPPHICTDPIGNYLDEFCRQSGASLVICEPKNRGKGDLVQQIALFSCPSTVSSNSSQGSQEVLFPDHDSFELNLHESKDANEKLNPWYEDCLERKCNLPYPPFEDPFANLL